MAKKPNVFISFHHQDVRIKEKFERIFENHYDIIASSSVREGKIPRDKSPEETMDIIRRNHLKNSILTVVLIGQNTYKRNFVDWEIRASLRQKEHGKKRSALIGIFVPEIENGATNHKSLIPNRLADNIKNGYAKCYDWTADVHEMKQWIEEALSKRKLHPKNNRKEQSK